MDASNRARAAKERRAVKGYDDILRAIRTGTTKTGADAEKVARGRGRSARRYRLSPEKQAERLAKVKAKIDAKNPTYKSPITGGELPVGGLDYQKRQQQAYDAGLSAAGQGTQTGNIPVDPYKILPSGKKGQEGIPQKDREQQQQQQQQQQNKSSKKFRHMVFVTLVMTMLTVK